MRYIIVNNQSSLFKKYESDIYKLRHQVFKEKLRWKVSSIGNKEIDTFDLLKEVAYILAIDDDQNLIGCMRLLPTTNKYMLEHVFKGLLPVCPKHKDIWEISRFTIDPKLQKDTCMLCLNTPTLLLLKGLCEFAKQNNITSYVAATTATLNRLVRTVHMDTKIIGQPMVIEETKVIALQIFMNKQTFNGIDNRLIEEHLLEVA